MPRNKKVISVPTMQGTTGRGAKKTIGVAPPRGKRVVVDTIGDDAPAKVIKTKPPRK